MNKKKAIPKYLNNNFPNYATQSIYIAKTCVNTFVYGGAPKNWHEASAQEMAQLLPEDHITCLAEDTTTGMILFGIRLKGIGVFDPLQEQYVGDLNSYWKTNDRFIRAIVPLPDRRVSFGCYLGGFTTIDPKKQLKALAKKSGITKSNRQASNRQINTVATKNFPPLPSVIKPLSIEELKAMQAKLESLNEPLPTPYAGYLGEDWKTQGDWTGRIYRDFAMMCAAVSPFDRLIVISDRFYGAYPFIGPNQEKYDDVRYWVHWVKTDNPKSLWDPVNGYRRQAEWDDHGEAYPLTQDGPDLWYVLDINRTGVFRIGMYFYNKDGHAGMNRLRDYEIEFYPSPKDWIPDVSQRKDFVEIGESLVRKESPLLKSRVSDFWGGVHKQFIVTGPMPYLVKIRRNNSYNTILSSVTVDRLIGVPTYVEEYGIPFSNFVKYEPPPLPSECSSGVGSQILLLWEELDKKYAFRKNVNVQRQYRVAAYQAASAFSSKEAVMNQLAYSLKWRLNQWDDAQRQEWMTIMKQNWQIFYDTNPTLRKTIESHKYGVPEIFKDWPH